MHSTTNLYTSLTMMWGFLSCLYFELQGHDIWYFKVCCKTFAKRYINHLSHSQINIWRDYRTLKCKDWWILPCLASLVHSEYKLLTQHSLSCSDNRLCLNCTPGSQPRNFGRQTPNPCHSPPEERCSTYIVLGNVTNFMATYCKKLKCLFSIKPVRSSQDVFGVWIINFRQKGLIATVSILGIVQSKHLHKDQHPQQCP